MDAPSGSVEFLEADELARLRRRAYGPGADIAGDAAAQARLAELEASRRRWSSAFDADEHGAAGTSITNGAEPEPAWRRRRWSLVLGGALAAFALIVGYVAGVSRLLAPESTSIPNESSTATMPPVPDEFPQGFYLPRPHEILALRSVGAAADRPNDRHGVLELLGISPDELRRYADFDGLNIWSGESRNGMTCLFVAVPVQGIREGYGVEGCAPEGSDTIAELPQQGGISFMRFVLRDDHVDVYVFERAAEPSG